MRTNTRQHALSAPGSAAAHAENPDPLTAKILRALDIGGCDEVERDAAAIDCTENSQVHSVFGDRHLSRAASAPSRRDTARLAVPPA